MELLDNQAERNKQVNFKREVGRYLKKWPWFVLIMLLFYIGSQIYLRYVLPQYLSKTSLMLLESKNKNSALSDLKNLGMGVSGDNELQGETTVIVSKPILTQVAENLNLNVAFYSIGKILEVELYKDAQLTGKILSLKNADTFSGSSIVISSAGSQRFRIIEGPSKGKVFSFGVPIQLPFGTIQLESKGRNSFSGSVKVVFRSIPQVVSTLEHSVSVALPENKGLLMELSLVGAVPKKSEDILNEITKQYNIDGVKDKNQEAQNTQNFINDRLEVITNDLSGIESEKESFKRNNEITDLDTQAGIAVGNADDYTKKMVEYSTQLDLVNSIYALSGTEQLLPSNMGLSSAAEQYVTAYNEALLTRNRVLKQATPENPSVIELSKQVTELRNLVRKNLVESRETLNLQIAQAKARLNVSKGQIDRYPTQEKIFRNIDRNQKLKEQLYLYLLQKREENAITLAVTAPKSKVVNPAFTTGQVKPNRQQITSSALAIGFLLPLAFFFVMNTIDTKVYTRLQIQSLVSDIPVIAEIPFKSEERAIVNPKDFSPFAESFRILTSNLKYLLKTKVNSSPSNGNVILVTSSIKGEGKTTIAMNTALTLAWRSKVLLIGADIRNPQLHRFIKGENVGLTDYLISDDDQPEDYIVHSNVTENLSVLFSGAIAPNPNDLLDMEKFDVMMKRLRETYDYIIIDSAPVMLVSDTLNILKHADVVLYLLKSGYTEKEMLAFATEFKSTNNIKNISFVLNNVYPQNSRYGKKYGYGYYVYGQEKPPTKWQKMGESVRRYIRG